MVDTNSINTPTDKLANMPNQGASLGLNTGLWAVAAALWARWRIHMPVPAERIESLPIAINHTVWILIAILFVFGAQLVVERTEV